MAKIDPITVSALKVLRLDTDRLPRNHNDLVFAARRRTKLKVWTREQTDAYRHLWDRIGQLQVQQGQQQELKGQQHMQQGQQQMQQGQQMQQQMQFSM